jgi:CubicO group peptidase (beta-lactamase class C family)
MDHKRLSVMHSLIEIDPQKAGLDGSLLSKAIDFAIKNESSMDRNIGAALEKGHFEEPWPIGKTIGPVKSRKAGSGVILRSGQLVKTWGDTEYVDMTFSISKSYLSLCMGIAVKDGIIPDIHAPIKDIVKDGGFDSEQNKDITWAHMLQLTSEWEGTLWDKPDWIDHYRDVMGDTTHAEKRGSKRTLQPPGIYWEYNDVRVNQLSFALMKAFGRSLPEVLQERIMGPIGATKTWEWHGYENSWLEFNGKKIQSVSGGAHWGGGLWISTKDHARVGQLMLNKGRWNDEEIIPENWIAECTTPCSIAPFYGYLWWLNDVRNGLLSGTPKSAYCAMGVGTQIIYVDPENDLVVVARWIEQDKVSEFLRMVLASIEK